MSKKNSKQTKQNTLAVAPVDSVIVAPVAPVEQVTPISKVEKLFALFIQFIINTVLQLHEQNTLNDKQRIEIMQFSLLKQFAILHKVTFTNEMIGQFGKNIFPIFELKEYILNKKESNTFYNNLNKYVFTIEKDSVKIGYVASIARIGFKFFVSLSEDELKLRSLRNENYKILSEKEKEETKKAIEAKKSEVKTIVEKVEQVNEETGKVEQVEQIIPILNDSEVDTLIQDSEKNISIENVIENIE